MSHDVDQRFSGAVVDLLCITSMLALIGFEKIPQNSEYQNVLITVAKKQPITAGSCFTIQLKQHDLHQ